MYNLQYNHKLKYVEFEVHESSNGEFFFFWFSFRWTYVTKNIEQILAKLSIHATYFPLAGLKTDILLTIPSY